MFIVLKTDLFRPELMIYVEPKLNGSLVASYNPLHLLTLKMKSVISEVASTLNFDPIFGEGLKDLMIEVVKLSDVVEYTLPEIFDENSANVTVKVI